MRITFVKKILANGEPCGKCADVESRLDRDGYRDRIDRIVIADERDPMSEGMRIAADFGVSRAPFLLVEEPSKTSVYDIYFKFVNEVMKAKSSEAESARDLLHQNPDLDYI
ncbi:MAG: hypothetical protein FJ194_16810 [Gammaproteobacteria bacterium]|nr:hypothetical protein [Gammaproteobacteria bacterium]